jgi:hypothetical protein
MSRVVSVHRVASNHEGRMIVSGNPAVSDSEARLSSLCIWHGVLCRQAHDDDSGLGRGTGRLYSTLLMRARRDDARLSVARAIGE